MTTIGVKIDKKSVELESNRVELVIWDIYGQDDFQKVRMSYLRGASGYLLVPTARADRHSTSRSRLQESAEQTVGQVPFIVAVNKADLSDQWEVAGARPAAAHQSRVARHQDERQDRRRSRSGVYDPGARDGQRVEA